MKTRNALVILLVIASGLCIAASEKLTTHMSRPPSPTTTALRSVQMFASLPFRLSFVYPAEWVEYRYQWASSFQASVVYLANVPVRDPCDTETNGSAMTVSCGDPLDALHRGGVLVTWTSVGFPQPPGVSEVPNANTTIAGQPARVIETRPGDCALLGSQATIVADIARPDGGHFDMRACLREPGLTPNTRLVRSMLRSVAITG